ncbi:MAG: DUF4388 domain-containing protein [Ktedonobacteraceae bacterium]|nr:DUF4388 domain-containing protein [Ktedonobacteraceae bacterium]
MRSRGTVTDKLADVVQVLQMARKTGLLTVNRDGVNSSVEQGMITLRNGEIVDASVGSLRGPAALNSLMMWRTCYFVFQPLSASNTTGPLPVSSSSNNGLTTGPIYGREPTHPRGYQDTTPSGMYNIPYRVREANEVLPFFNGLGLSRAHRQLFLLIDGKRTVQELMRLMGHRLDEVAALLSDLERAGLIRQ